MFCFLDTTRYPFIVNVQTEWELYHFYDELCVYIGTETFGKPLNLQTPSMIGFIKQKANSRGSG